MVYESLRAAIIERAFSPGDALSRPKLARRYGTSQTPVREALLRLEAEGLVRVRPQAGTVVAPIRVLDLHQTMFLRRSLEEAVVRRLAARPDAQDIAVLRARAEAAVTEDADWAFHQALFAAAGMGALLERIQPLLVACQRYRAMIAGDEARTRAALAEHADIVACIERGEPSGAALAMGAHLASELQDLDAVRRDNPEFFSDD